MMNVVSPLEVIKVTSGLMLRLYIEELRHK